jgi:competence protein ComEA
MRSSRSSSEHQEAVSRRLALLSAELAAVREDDGLREGAAAEVAVAAAAPEPPTRPRGWIEPDFVVPPTWEPDLTARAASSVAAHPVPVSIPVPGRHAARRSRIWHPAGFPRPDTDRLSLGPAQLAVVAIALALGVALTCWWLLRSRPTELAAPSATAPVPALVTPDGTTGGATGVAPVSVVVDVAGKVRHPGITVLDAGARVIDAIDAAGGTRPGVDLSTLNLARILVDGEQIMVGVPTPPGAVAAPPSSGGAGPPGGLVNLNTADQTQLEALPEVGPVTAQAIIGWREAHGGFSAVDELLDVDGIGEATLSRIAPWVTV